MPIKVTENWSGYRLSFKPPWTASREFVVTGVTTGSEALAAKDDNDSTLKIPGETDEHPESASLICDGPEIKERKGTDFWVISANYHLDDGKIELIGGDPLKALQITLIANAFLEARIDQLTAEASAGFSRGRVKKPKPRKSAS